MSHNYGGICPIDNQLVNGIDGVVRAISNEAKVEYLSSVTSYYVLPIQGLHDIYECRGSKIGFCSTVARFTLTIN